MSSINSVTAYLLPKFAIVSKYKSNNNLISVSDNERLGGKAYFTLPSPTTTYISSPCLLFIILLYMFASVHSIYNYFTCLRFDINGILYDIHFCSLPYSHKYFLG